MIFSRKIPRDFIFGFIEFLCEKNGRRTKFASAQASPFLSFEYPLTFWVCFFSLNIYHLNIISSFIYNIYLYLLIYNNSSVTYIIIVRYANIITIIIIMMIETNCKTNFTTQHRIRRGASCFSFPFSKLNLTFFKISFSKRSRPETVSFTHACWQKKKTFAQVKFNDFRKSKNSHMRLSAWHSLGSPSFSAYYVFLIDVYENETLVLVTSGTKKKNARFSGHRFVFFELISLSVLFYHRAQRNYDTNDIFFFQHQNRSSERKFFVGSKRFSFFFVSCSWTYGKNFDGPEMHGATTSRVPRAFANLSYY